MKRPVLISVIIIIILILVFGNLFYTRPMATRICIYPTSNNGQSFNIQQLRAYQPLCFDDPKTLSVFNGAGRSFNFLKNTKGGYYGFYTDDHKKEHLMRVMDHGAIFVDSASGNKYNYDKASMPDDWKKLIHNNE